MLSLRSNSLFLNVTMALALFELFASPAKGLSQGTDSVAFRQNLSQAQYLLQAADYVESTASSFMRTNRTLAFSPGVKAFALQENGVWHVTYLAFEGNGFTPIATFYPDSSAHPYVAIFSYQDSVVARALITCFNVSEYAMDTTGLSFDFIPVFQNNLLYIWILPAYQPSGQGVYNWQWEFEFAPEANKLLNSWPVLGQPRGVWIGQPRVQWLNCRELEAPPINSLYFALKYISYFTKINIECKKSIFILKKESQNGTIWEIIPKL